MTPDITPVLSPIQVARRAGVTTATVSEWARAGRLRWILTPGGGRRYCAADVRALLEGSQP